MCLNDETSVEIVIEIKSRLFYLCIRRRPWEKLLPVTLIQDTLNHNNPWRMSQLLEPLKI